MAILGDGCGLGRWFCNRCTCVDKIHFGRKLPSRSNRLAQCAVPLNSSALLAWNTLQYVTRKPLFPMVQNQHLSRLLGSFFFLEKMQWSFRARKFHNWMCAAEHFWMTNFMYSRELLWSCVGCWPDILQAYASKQCKFLLHRQNHVGNGPSVSGLVHPKKTPTQQDALPVRWEHVEHQWLDSR